MRGLTKFLQSILNTVWLIIGRRVAELPLSCNKVVDVTSIKVMRYYLKIAYSPHMERFFSCKHKSTPLKSVGILIQA